LAAGLVDSHCHLDFVEGDIDRVVASARQAGLVAIINPGTSLKTSRAAVALAEKHPLVYAAVGVHPHDASVFDGETAAALRELAAHPKVVAIGEIGLDYYRNLSPHDAQQRAFEAQLELAAELGLPVIIHNRDATEDAFARLRDWVARANGRRGVLHSYSAGPEWLEQATQLGFFIGISGPVTYPKAKQLQQVAREVPLDRLLVETDAPFLTPAPFRGRRNQPAYVQYVAEKIAALRDVPVEQIGRQTTRNVIRLFGQIGTALE
jgi:TatD DNase family protein